MVGLLEFRQKLKMIYAEYSAYFIPVIKFFMVFLTLTTMNRHIGYMDRLNSMAIVLLVSLVCCILPAGASTFFVSIFMLAHLFSLSLIGAGLALAVLLIMFCTYYIFQPKDSILLYLVPVAFALKIPYVVPMVMGLVGGFFSAIPVSFGVILYYMLRWVKLNSSLLSASSTLEPLQQLMEMVTGVLKNKEMIVVIIAFTATLFVVYLIRRLSIQYCWEIAIGVGSLVDILILLVGSSSLDLNIEMGPVLLGVTVAALIALVLMFFQFLVDFNRTVRTQFEDDEYYYYVKAVPKVTVAPREKKVKKIAAPKKKAASRIEELEEERRKAVIAQAHADEKKTRRKKASEESGESKDAFATQEIVPPARRTEEVPEERPMAPEEKTDDAFDQELAEMAAEFAELDAKEN